MIYEVEQSHALLVERAARLPPEKFLGQVETAEALLKLGTAPMVTRESDVRRVVLALVHQVNFQVTQGIDPLIEYSSSSSQSRQSRTYRNRWISPLALSVLSDIEALVSGGYSGTMRSVRTEGGHSVGLRRWDWYR